jgi:Tfp pilus assembly protein PilX
MNLSRLRAEEGFALATSMILMSVMLLTGLAIVAYGDGQTSQVRQERVRESSFNLAERALEQQTFKLSRSWAGAASTAYPATCSPAVTLDLCPNNAELISAGDAPDANASTTWVTSVRDNGDDSPATDNTGESFYSPALIDNRPSWDANKDGVVWVKASAVVRGKLREVVAKVRVESLVLPFPKVSITANRVFLSNTGNKKIIDTNGPNDGDIGPVLVGCGANPNDCIVSNGGKIYDPAADPRIDPPSVGTRGPDPIVDTLTHTQLKETARANGTIYATCPTDAQLTGAVVYILEVPAGGCSYNINGEINSAASPGVIVIEKSLGRFELRGNLGFWGLLYFMNKPDGPPADTIVLDLDGTIIIHGSVAVEGTGSVRVGSSGDGGQDEPNVSFDQSLFGQIKAYGTAGILQNSWREIN